MTALYPPYIYVLVLVRPEIPKTSFLRMYGPRRCVNTEDINQAMRFNTSAAAYDFLNRTPLPNKYHLMLFYNCGGGKWNPNGCGPQPTTVVS